MGKFMQWTAAIALYFGLSLATFNRNLDPKEGMYVDKYTQTAGGMGKADKTGTEIYGLDWAAVKKAKVKINPDLPAEDSR